MVTVRGDQHGVHFVEHDVLLESLRSRWVGERENSVDCLGSFPGVEQFVVDVAVGLQLPVGGSPRGERLFRTESVPRAAEVLVRGGEAQPIVDPRAALVVSDEHLDDGWRRHPVVNLDGTAIGRIRIDSRLAAHEAQWRHVHVLRARHRPVPQVEHQRWWGGVLVQIHQAGVEPEMVVALHAAHPIFGIGIEQVKRTRPGQLGIGADAVVTLAPAVPRGVPAGPFVRRAVGRGFFDEFHAHAIQAHTGARTLGVIGALAVVVLDDHLGVRASAHDEADHDDQHAQESRNRFHC